MCSLDIFLSFLRYNLMKLYIYIYILKRKHEKRAAMPFSILFKKPQTKFRCRWLSRTNVNAGFLMGSVLWPLFFWIHINNLPNG